MEKLRVARPDRRTFLRMAALMASGVAVESLLQGCGSSSAPASSPAASKAPASASASAAASSSSAPAKPKEIVKIQAAAPHFKDIINPLAGHIGLAKGFYKEEGLDVEYFDYAGGGELVRAITSGTNPIGFTSVPGLLLALQKNEPGKIIGGAFNKAAIYMMVRNDSPYKDITDLKGKKIGVSRAGSNTHFLALMAMSAAKMDIKKDAEIVFLGGTAEMKAGLLGKVVEASFFLDPMVSEMEKAGEARVLFKNEKYIPEFADIVSVAHLDLIKNKPDVVRAFLNANQKANEFIIANPDEAGKIWAKAIDQPEEFCIAGIKKVPKEAWTIQISMPALKAVQQGMILTEQLKSELDMSKFIDQSCLPEKMRVKI